MKMMMLSLKYLFRREFVVNEAFKLIKDLRIIFFSPQLNILTPPKPEE